MSGLNLADDQKTNVGLLNYYETKKQHAITNARQNAKTNDENVPTQQTTVQRIKSGTKYNGISVKAGDVVSNVNKAPKAKENVVGTALRTNPKTGKKELVIAVKETGKARVLTDKGKAKLDNGETVSSADYEPEGEPIIRQYKSTSDPQMIDYLLRNSIVDNQGKRYANAKEYVYRELDKTVELNKPKTQSAPKAKATTKKTNTVKGNKDSNL